MSIVYCYNKDCVHCDQKESICKQPIIQVGYEFENVCSEYESFLDTEEYSEKYYILVKTKDGTLARAEKQGKKIEYKGIVFFTSDRVNESGDYVITEATTGLLIGMFCNLEERYTTICEFIPKCKNISEFPLAEWNDKKRNYEIVDSEQH